jgi:hypothetical protein
MSRAFHRWTTHDGDNRETSSRQGTERMRITRTTLILDVFYSSCQLPNISRFVRTRAGKWLLNLPCTVVCDIESSSVFIHKERGKRIFPEFDLRSVSQHPSHRLMTFERHCSAVSNLLVICARP